MATSGPARPSSCCQGRDVRHPAPWDRASGIPLRVASGVRPPCRGPCSAEARDPCRSGHRDAAGAATMASLGMILKLKPSHSRCRCTERPDLCRSRRGRRSVSVRPVKMASRASDKRSSSRP
jgi:hypothetical protein